MRGLNVLVLIADHYPAKPFCLFLFGVSRFERVGQLRKADCTVFYEKWQSVGDLYLVCAHGYQSVLYRIVPPYLIVPCPDFMHTLPSHFMNSEIRSPLYVQITLLEQKYIYETDSALICLSSIKSLPDVDINYAHQKAQPLTANPILIEPCAILSIILLAYAGSNVWY